MKKPLTVVKSNKVIESSYRLTLNEQRLVLACIAKIKKGQRISANDRFEVSAVEFADVFKITVDQAYRELQEVAERLYARSITILNPDPKDSRITHLKTRWISSIAYASKQGSLVLRFAQDIIPFISLLEGNFKPYLLECVAGMSSIYGIRFYELMMQWESKGEREIALDELKRILDLDGQYAAIKDFKKYVIEPAMRDINEHSNLEASYTQRKSGRVVTHLIFKFKPKVTPKSEVHPKIKRITKSQIEKAARPGESYEEVKARLEEQLKLAI
jgi:plasmid replication initiation protein